MGCDEVTGHVGCGVEDRERWVSGEKHKESEIEIPKKKNAAKKNAVYLSSKAGMHTPACVGKKNKVM